MRHTSIDEDLNKSATALCGALAFAPLFLLILALTAPITFAQDSSSAIDRYPLRPADTSSPRDTLRSFDTAVIETHRASQAGEPYEAVVQPFLRAVETLDVSQLPRRGRLAKELESVYLLKEILDRIELPPVDEIPGDEEVTNTENPVTRWRIPNTRITIAKVEEGPRAGEFLFTAETIKRLEEFYERSKHLPYKPGALVGVYERLAHSSGYRVRRWATALPAWSKPVVLGEAIWKWLGFAIVGIAAFFIIRWLLRWGKRWDGRHRNAKALMRFGAPLSVVAAIGIVYASHYLFLHVIRIISDFWILLSAVLWTLIFSGAIWLVLLIGSRLAEVINEARHVREGSIDGQLLRTVFRLLSLVIVVCLVIYAADFFGIPLTPVVAGLGIGGLAIALAVRPTLENIIGGLTLFADKPVRIGDFCRYGDEIGTIEQIGLRSTRLRKRDDTLVSVPNADFSQRELINFSARRQRLLRTTLGLRYETTPDQMRYVLVKLREMMLSHPKVSPDRARVRFVGYGAYSKDVEIFAYLRCQDKLTFLAIQEDLLLRMEDIINVAGTGFAFPSQTAYLTRDTGLDAERRDEAETSVEQWRIKGKLPFPEFEDEESERLQDTLDYPPKGSPDYTPRVGLSEKGSKSEFKGAKTAPPRQ